jgi:endonuclease YncB( thermonuclease family)
VNCVIDGDTIWYQGEKIRIADINAPETHDPHCTYEAGLGKRATDRMISLLNAGPFQIVSTGDRDEDVYGRKLRIVERNGYSLGQTLVKEGLAERWQGYRRNWCI